MENLKKIRKQKGIKQIEIANHLNVTEATYSRYEAGKTNMTPESLKKVAEYLDVTADYLLGLINVPLTIAENYVRRNLHAEDDEILDKVTLTLNGEDLTEEESRKLLKIIRALDKDQL